MQGLRLVCLQSMKPAFKAQLSWAQVLVNQCINVSILVSIPPEQSLWLEEQFSFHEMLVLAWLEGGSGSISHDVFASAQGEVISSWGGLGGSTVPGDYIFEDFQALFQTDVKDGY